MRSERVLRLDVHLQGACLRLQAVSKLTSAAATSRSEKFGIVRFAVAPHSPEHADEASSEGGYSYFSAASLGDGLGPNAQRISGIVMPEDTPGALDQERA